jgi:protein O-mannosyl-transferase
MNIDKDFELNLNWSFQNLRNHTVAFVLLFALLALVYSNSFDCSWHFDDFVNIKDNASIRIKNFSWTEIEKSFSSLSGIEKSLYGNEKSWTFWSRPVSYFSFAINFYFGGTNVFGYHIVNFTIHYLSSVFLFLFIYNMLKLPMLNERYGRYAYSAALLSAVLWAIHPIQVTAVTYIVQRMASMVSLFYIVAMYLYLKGRTARTITRAIILYLFCFVSFVLAFFSKQNAVMLPVSLILFDLYFIQGINRNNVIRTAKVLFAMLICCLIILFFYIRHDPSTMDYSMRMFSVAERLLTQPRIFFYYISLLLYPLNARLMLNHDFNISKSLFDPWTTIISIVTLILLLCIALWKSRRMPILSYCILFFFINHLIEGSFFSLELFYEHRNYLPSMLFFLPIAIGLLNIMNYFSERKSIFRILFIAITSIMIIWGIATFMYNDIFKNELTLWRDNALKAPALHNPHHNLALAFLNAGHLKEAYDECNIALQLDRVSNKTNKPRDYIVLALYYIAMDDRDSALIYTNKALKYFPIIAGLYDIKGLILMEKKELSAAEKEIRKAISLEPDQALLRVHLGFIFLKQNHFHKAIKEAQKALQINPDSWEAYLLLSNAFREKDDRQWIADHFFQVNRRLQFEKRLTAAKDG